VRHTAAGAHFEEKGLGVLRIAGCASKNSSSSGSNATVTPTFSVGAGSYNVAQTVTIADTTVDAALYCTIDSTTPTTSSPQCGKPTTVCRSEFLQAIALVMGIAPSAVVSSGYTINLQCNSHADVQSRWSQLCREQGEVREVHVRKGISYGTPTGVSFPYSYPRRLDGEIDASTAFLHKIDSRGPIFSDRSASACSRSRGGAGLAETCAWL
jgi:hypothetical protein